MHEIQKKLIEKYNIESTIERSGFYYKLIIKEFGIIRIHPCIELYTLTLTNGKLIKLDPLNIIEDIYNIYTENKYDNKQHNLVNKEIKQMEMF